MRAGVRSVGAFSVTYGENAPTVVLLLVHPTLESAATLRERLEADGLDPAAPLDTLGIDSLSFIEFMFKVEEEFGVSVSDEDLKAIKTLADLERHVAAALAAAGKA